MLIKEVKKIINEINLPCIASYVVGAYTTLLINYFWFDNNITPPGVSAFVASLALLFTIYAAFKVKEWSEQKMNDKAFKQAENIIDELNSCYRNFILASSCITLLTDSNHTKSVSIADKMIKKYESHKDLYQFKTPEILNEIDILTIWKYTTPYRSIFTSYITEVNLFDAKVVNAVLELKPGDANATKRFQSHHNELDAQRKKVSNIYKSLTKLTFDNLFVPTRTDIK